MRLAKLGEDLINKSLAIAIKTKDGRKLINEGTVLSEKLIGRLINSGFNAVYIEDVNYEVELKETLNNKERALIYTKIKDIFAGIEKDEFNSIELLRFIRRELLPEIKNEPVSIPVDQLMEKEDYIQHSINVAILAAQTAMLYGLNTERIELMAFTALMHDIGKIIKKRNLKYKDLPHYEVAYEFLKRKNCSIITYMTIRFQEVSYDGSGPYKVSKDKQIDLAKILSICDYYENLLRTSTLMPYECFERTQALVNSKFDPEVFKAFRKAIYIYPVGLPVQLSNKAKGVIIRQNEAYPLRPVIKTIDNYYNLMDNLTLFIEMVAI